MQGAAQFVAKHEPLNERPAIVRTTGSDREEFAAATHQDHIGTTDLSLYHSAIRKTINRDSLAEIWSTKAFHIFHLHGFCQYIDGEHTFGQLFTTRATRRSPANQAHGQSIQIGALPGW